MSRRFITEVDEEKKKALVVYEKHSGIIEYIKKEIRSSFMVYESTYSIKEKENKHTTGYDLAIFVNCFPVHKKNIIHNKLNIFFIFYSKELYREKRDWCKRHLRNYKIVFIEKTEKPLREIVNFVLFKTPTPYEFSFEKRIVSHPVLHIETNPKVIVYAFIRFILILIVGLNVLFFVFFTYQLFQLYQARLLTQKNTHEVKSFLISVKKIQTINNTLVLVPKNTLFWVPGIDSFFRFTNTIEKTTQFLDQGYDLFENYNLLSRLFLKKNKTEAQKKEALLRINYAKEKVDLFGDLYYSLISDWRETNLLFLNKRKEKILSKAEELNDYLIVARELTKKLPYLTGAEGRIKYLILFMNNMELRPGGGFIGSLGVLDFKDFSLNEIQVYDVYTLDGQLKIHVDPPLPIRTHLSQPNWFLRDSNFTPDFTKNSQQALRFIKLEVNWTDIDAVVGVTFTSVQRIIELFPNFRISDYNETITPDNFFIKAQTHAEKDFTPGSHGKRNFLESVLRTLIVRLNEGDFDGWKLIQILRNSFDEKFMAVYFNKDEVQSIFDKLFWTGRMVKSGCTADENCFFDYLMVADANLGVNKANFFVQRSARLMTELSGGGKTVDTLVLNYSNESVPGVFPGGTYKNYVQIYIPKDTTITSVLVDGKQVKYDLGTDFDFNRIGLLLSVPPGRQRNLLVKYGFSRAYNKTKTYQLVVQKQIGSINTDFIYEMKFDSGLQILDTNFTPVVTKNAFVYNTFLEKDRLLSVRFK